jgi:mercuric ion binding protein
MLRSVFYLVFLLAGSMVQPVIAADLMTQTQQQIRQAVLDIQGMNCALCPITIRKKLEKTPGVIEAKVDFDKKMAWVEYDETRVKSQDLIDAVTNIGYKATLHTTK